MWYETPSHRVTFQTAGRGCYYPWGSRALGGPTSIAAASNMDPSSAVNFAEAKRWLLCTEKEVHSIDHADNKGWEVTECVERKPLPRGVIP